MRRQDSGRRRRADLSIVEDEPLVDALTFQVVTTCVNIDERLAELERKETAMNARVGQWSETI